MSLGERVSTPIFFIQHGLYLLLNFLLTWFKASHFILQALDLLLELGLLHLFDMFTRKHFQVNQGHFRIFTIQLIQFFKRVKRNLRTRIIRKFISLTSLLILMLITLQIMTSLRSLNHYRYGGLKSNFTLT